MPALVVESSSSRQQPRHNSFLARYQVHFPTALDVLVEEESKTVMTSSFQPGDNDVVCGRGKGSYNRPGNKRFRAIAQQYIAKYTASKTRLDKSLVINTVIEKVREHGRFVKYDSKKKRWMSINEELTREKVGHAIREAIVALESRGQQEDGKNFFSHKQSNLLTQQKELFAKLLKSKSGSLSAVVSV
jgi:hypothetical protein